jgi:hypothetical protein
VIRERERERERKRGGGENPIQRHPCVESVGECGAFIFSSRSPSYEIIQRLIFAWDCKGGKGEWKGEGIKCI